MIPEHGKCKGFVKGKPWQEGRDCYICWSAANDPKWQKFFTEWRPAIQMPKFAKRIMSFSKAAWRHIIHGLPTATPVQQVERFSKCQPCEYLSSGACMGCGCGVSKEKATVLNKLRWAAESCPIGKWGPVPGEKIWARAWQYLSRYLPSLKS